MKEQSHKAEMSAAIRGDFQRLRARGVSAALVPQDEPDPDQEPPVVAAAPVVRDEPPVVPADPTAEPAPAEPEHEPPPRRGWLSRLSGR